MVAQFVPSVQVPIGAQLAGPGVKEVPQPAGNAGAVTSSKLSRKTVMTPGVVVGVDVGTGEAVAVGVASGV